MQGGVVIIILATKSKEKEVIEFLNRLKDILSGTDFDIDRDITLVTKQKQGDDQKYSTPYTIADLDYDTGDVIERLKELTVKEYSETRIDRDNLDPPLLFVFGKDINGRLVYIKLKIRENERGHVVCVSFHYAKERMLFPYA